MTEKPAPAFFKRFSPVFLAALALAAPAYAKVELEVPQSPAVQGGIFFASIESSDEIKEASGMFQDHVIEFFPDGEHQPDGGFKKYSALVGVEYATKPGNVELKVKVKVGNDTVERSAQVAVKEGVFPSEKLRVPPRTVAPSKADMKLIAKDQLVLHKAYSTITLTKFWDPPAQMPVEFPVTSMFGTSRVYNGIKHNAHLGTDLRAPMGTPIAAPLTGQVAVARKLFFTGNTVILDHGYGLFTIYGHMSKLKVKEGEIVKKGQIMGLSGMTGRASGPHLHWGVNLHGTKIDPLVLVQALNRQG